MVEVERGSVEEEIRSVSRLSSLAEEVGLEAGFLMKYKEKQKSVTFSKRAQNSNLKTESCHFSTKYKI